MPSYVCRIGEAFIVFSTVSNSFVTPGMTREELAAWWRERQEARRRSEVENDRELARHAKKRGRRPPRARPAWPEERYELPPESAWPGFYGDEGSDFGMSLTGSGCFGESGNHNGPGDSGLTLDEVDEFLVLRRGALEVELREGESEEDGGERVFAAELAAYRARRDREGGPCPGGGEGDECGRARPEGAALCADCAAILLVGAP